MGSVDAPSHHISPMSRCRTQSYVLVQPEGLREKLPPGLENQPDGPVLCLPEASGWVQTFLGEDRSGAGLVGTQPVWSHRLCAQNAPDCFMLFCCCLGIISNF